MKQTSKKSTWMTLLFVAALLAVVVIMETVLDPNKNIMVFTALKKGAVYALVAVSMNLLNGFTGLFSLGQAGFMLLGAYTYAIMTIPAAQRDAVYYIYNGSAINFSLPELFGGGPVGLVLGVIAALILGGCVAAVVAWLIGLPVLRLKSDYLAIATLGFGAVGDGAQLIPLEHRPDDLAEAQGGNGQIVAFQPQHRQADEPAEKGRQQAIATLG